MTSIDNRKSKNSKLKTSSAGNSPFTLSKCKKSSEDENVITSPMWVNYSRKGLIGDIFRPRTRIKWFRNKPNWDTSENTISATINHKMDKYYTRPILKLKQSHNTGWCEWTIFIYWCLLYRQQHLKVIFWRSEVVWNLLYLWNNIAKTKIKSMSLMWCRFVMNLLFS